MALTLAFASNGDKLEVPETSTGDGTVSYETGFGGLYALSPEEGGLFINRAQFNQLMYDTTSAVLENKQSIDDLGDITYTKTEVNNLLNAKANANATVNLTGNQSIAGVKTFSSPPVSATNPTANNQVANKAYVDSRLGRAYITETYVNGMSWYRVWSDKWCEQGGSAPTQIVESYRGTVTLLKAYKDTNYSIFTVVIGGKSEHIWGSDNSIASITRTGFQMNTQNNGTINCRNWYTCGYIS